MLSLIYVVYNKKYNISADPFLQKLLGAMADCVNAVVIINNDVESCAYRIENFLGVTIHYMIGSNKNREFGGYLEGLAYLQNLYSKSNGYLVVNDTINDSKHPLEKIIMPAIFYWISKLSRSDLNEKVIIGEINRPPLGGALKGERSQEWASTYLMLFHRVGIQEISECINMALERSAQTSLNTTMTQHLNRQLAIQNKLSDQAWYQAKKKSTIVELLFSIELKHRDIHVVDLYSIRWAIRAQYFIFRLRRKFKFLWGVYAKCI